MHFAAGNEITMLQVQAGIGYACKSGWKFKTQVLYSTDKKDLIELK